MRITLGISLLSLSSFCSFGQWNNNTSLNTPVCTAANYQVDLRMAEDGQGGTFIVWKDYRNGTPDIFAQHIDANGFALWNPDGAPVCTQSADQSTPGVILDGNGGIIVSWSDWRSGIERDIYAQRLDANGNPLWTYDGTVVVNKVNREHNERLVTDGQGGVIVVFEQKNMSTYYWEIWAQRLNASGQPLWAPGGIPVTQVLSEHLNERIQSDGQGGVYVALQDFRNGFDYDVYVQHLGPNGEYLWGTGVLACNTWGTQTNPKIDPDYSTGGVIVSWTDKRNGVDYDIYAQRIDASGNLLWGDGGKAVCIAPGNQSAIDLLSNNEVNGVIFTWKDARNGDFDIYADRLDMTGVSQWQNNGLPICTSAGDQLNPNITGDGYGGATLVWQDAALGFFDIKAQRIYKEGIFQYPTNGIVLANATGDQSSPKSVSDDLGNGIFAWEDSRTGSPDIYCTKLTWGGAYVGVNEGNVSTVSIYPNPFTQKIQILSNQTGQRLIEVYAVDGTLVFSKSVLFTSNVELDLAELGAGVYLIKMGESVQRLIKE